MFKKSAIAVAVAGAVSVPLTVQAHEGGEPTVYGFVNIGIQNTTIDGPQTFGSEGTASNIFTGAPDDSTNASDTANTRFGFKGSKDLGNGISASYKLEFGVGTTSGGRGGPIEDAAPIDKRIAQIRFDGGFGSFTIGNQWGILYEYLGWNTYRSDGHGGAAWYEATRQINDDRYGLRVSNAFTYTYGGGGYSADPFTFSVQAILDPDTAPDPANGVAGNDETIDAISVGGAVTFGPVTLNAVVYSESDQFGPEPTLTGVGFRWRATDSLFFGGTFMNVDQDVGLAAGIDDDATTWNLAANLDFGGGYSGMFAIGGADTGEADGTGDLDTYFLQFQKVLGGGTKIYAELESAEREVGGGLEDSETTVFVVAIKQVF